MDKSPQSRQFSITWLLVVTALTAVAVRLSMWMPAWAVAFGSGLWWLVTLRLVPLPREMDRRDNSIGMMALMLSFLCWCFSMVGIFLAQFVLFGLGPSQEGYNLMMIVAVLVWLLALVTFLSGFMGLLVGSRRAAVLAIINLAVTVGAIGWFIDHM